MNKNSISLIELDVFSPLKIIYITTSRARQSKQILCLRNTCFFEVVSLKTLYNIISVAIYKIGNVICFCIT